MSPRPPFLPTLALIAALSPFLAAPAGAAGYPRLGLYGGIMGTGFPFILGGDRSGPLDEATCDSVARFDQVILDASPISEYRPDVAAALRARNPDISLLGYVNAGAIWPAAQPDSTVHYPTRLRRLVRDLDGFLYNRAGEHYRDYNINLAKRDVFGRYVVAEGMANLFHDAVVRSGVWDGMFLDVFCDGIDWTQTPAESIDFRRAGYPSLAAFNAGYLAGGGVLADRLRTLAGGSFLLVGNCARGTKYTTFNGWMRENFPFQNGGTWEENMFRDPGGYFVDEVRFRAPRHNYLFTAADPPWDPYTARNARKVRFGLGSGSLGEGYGTFGYSVRAVSDYNYLGWWYDEYAVDVATGRASGRPEHTGWLGQPLGPPWQMVWLGPGPDASTNPEFETDVTSGWEFTAAIPATLERDGTGAASGSAAARVRVPAAGDHAWRVTLATVGTLPVSTGRAYSATFWARASAPRVLPVTISLTTGGEVANRNINLTTEWRRHQVVLTAQGSGNGALKFFLANAAGDVWLDDVHFQEGVSNLWRRDFQNGIVLVNPALVPLTADLGRTFRRIAGTTDPAVNDGLPGSQVTVGAQDARFLLGDDQTAPAQVIDLRPIAR